MSSTFQASYVLYTYVEKRDFSTFIIPSACTRGKVIGSAIFSVVTVYKKKIAQFLGIDFIARDQHCQKVGNSNKKNLFLSA